MDTESQPTDEAAPEGTSPPAYADNVVASYLFRVTVRGASDPDLTVVALEQGVSIAIDDELPPGYTATVSGERLDR